MANDNLLATLENTLRQTRAHRSRLASRLAEVEQEASSIRAELSEMDALATQTEATMYRFMSAVLGGGGGAPTPPPFVAPPPAIYYQPPVVAPPPAPSEPVFKAAPASFVAAASGREFSRAERVDRFADLTIPQATAALLKETGGALHVNDIFERLQAGGFVFSGHNPTISIAVSLNRNPRFCKVSPGTFGLTG